MKHVKWLAALATVPWLAVAGCAGPPESAAVPPPSGGEGPSRAATSGRDQPATPAVNVGIQSTVPVAVTGQAGQTPGLTKNPPNARPGNDTPSTTQNYSR